MTDKTENLTLNRNWIWDNGEYIDIISWNKAIEKAANLANAKNGEASLTSIEIRKLKK